MINNPSDLVADNYGKNHTLSTEIERKCEFLCDFCKYGQNRPILEHFSKSRRLRCPKKPRFCSVQRQVRETNQLSTRGSLVKSPPIVERITLKISAKLG